MAELTDMEKARILFDIESIKKLKRKYWRLIDEKRMDELADCFTDDIVADYAIGKVLEGRDAVIRFLQESLGRKDRDIVSIHQGYNPEIEITGETGAAGRWGLYNYIRFGHARTVMTCWQVYDDSYVKINGEWKIKNTRLKYITSETSTTT